MSKFRNLLKSFKDLLKSLLESNRLMSGWELIRVIEEKEHQKWCIGYKVPGVYSGPNRYVIYDIDEEICKSLFGEKSNKWKYLEKNLDWIKNISIAKGGKLEEILDCQGNFQKRWMAIELEFMNDSKINESWPNMWSVRYSFVNGLARLFRTQVTGELNKEEFSRIKFWNYKSIKSQQIDVETDEPEQLKKYNLSSTYLVRTDSDKNNLTNNVNQVSAAIDLTEWEDYTTYFSAVKSNNRKGAAYPAKRAVREGYYCKRFEWENFIPDIVEINLSKEIRTGREMSASYKRSVEEMGGAPTEMASLSHKKYSKAWWISWGVFIHKEGHMQGDIVTNEKLVGYIGITREGELCNYGRLLGHGDYLRYGIMYLLHFKIMEELFLCENKLTNGVTHLAYASYLSGSNSSGTWNNLIPWKEKLMFKPHIFQVK